MNESIYNPSDIHQNLINNYKVQNINAEFDEEGIYFYQAYKQEIADYAIENQKLGGPHWSSNRMTWIKPSFAWMLYRSGYACKHNQTRILKIKISHQTFSEILETCKLTLHSSKNSNTDNKCARLQWDPERDLLSKEPKKDEPRKLVRTRAVQIGLAGKVLQNFAENIIRIDDVTDLAKRVHKAHGYKNDKEVSAEMQKLKSILPIERSYFPVHNSAETLQYLAILPGENAEMVSRLGRGSKVKIVDK